MSNLQPYRVKMLFETNSSGHKHPSISLFITEQDTIGETKENNKLHSTHSQNTVLQTMMGCSFYSTTLPVYVPIKILVLIAQFCSKSIVIKLISINENVPLGLIIDENMSRWVWFIPSATPYNWEPNFLWKLMVSTNLHKLKWGRNTK